MTIDGATIGATLGVTIGVEAIVGTSVAFGVTNAEDAFGVKSVTLKVAEGVNIGVLAYYNSNFQENVPYDAAEPAASRTCLFPSPFLRESGRGGDSLPTAPNFGV